MINVKNKKFIFGFIATLFVAILSLFIIIPNVKSKNDVYAFEYNDVEYSDKVWAYFNFANGEIIVQGRDFWFDGTNWHYDNYNRHYLVDFSTNTWTSVTWSGLSNFSGQYVWTDGVNYYLSNDSFVHYIIDISNYSISSTSWNFSDFSGIDVWSDGTNVFLSRSTLSASNRNYVLDKVNHSWSSITFSNAPRDNFLGRYIWFDGSNYRYDYNRDHGIINLSNYSYSSITLSGGNIVRGDNVWTDGVNYYYTDQDYRYLIDVSSNTLTSVNFFDIHSYSYFNGIDIFNANGSTYWFANINSYYRGARFIDFTDLLNGGYDTGYNAGLVDGRELGYQDGYTAGETAGYDTGYTAGETAGYDTGYTAGESVGYQDGYTAGETAGYNDGYDLGLSDGYTAGYNAGLSESYDTGYQAGYTSGYNNGYNAYSDLGFYPYSYNNSNVHQGRYIWFDGTNYYYDYYGSSANQFHFVYDNVTSSWVVYTPNVAEFNGKYVWTDGIDIYYSRGNVQLIYDKSSKSWSTFSFSGLSNFFVDTGYLYNYADSNNFLNSGFDLFYDGSHYCLIYNSYDNVYYELDSTTHTWTNRTLNGIPANYGFYNAPFYYNGVLYGLFCEYTGTSIYDVNLSTLSLYTLTSPSNTFVFVKNVYSYSNDWLSGTYHAMFWSDNENLYLSQFVNVASDSNFNFVIDTDTFDFDSVSWALNSYVPVQDMYLFYNTIHLDYSNGDNTGYKHFTFNSVDYDAYTTGYNIGYSKGFSDSKKVLDYQSISYQTGYNNGVNSAGEFTFFSLMSSVVDAPVSVLSNLLNFNILGFNLWAFATGLISFLIIFFILKKIINKG